ncbi:MAG TPA: serine/threonine-protein kinase [Bryobacteraceae bacterium]|nr:serine/threonine-protein kinase [Bryobacteraceae bacterium]
MEQIGRYRILEELGRGAMGVVCKALDPKIGRTVAIKSIRLSDLTDTSERQRVRDRLLREAQSAGVLSHPNIVTIYDILEQQDLAYIFMEYVSGPSLEKMMRDGALPSREQLVQLLRQTAAALDYAHQKGIVHRDIKPANLLVADGGSGEGPIAKITDFGVAKFVSQELTHSGNMIGTPNYMSPEQIQGTTVGPQSDQFSLAVLVYELLTGAKPFTGESLPALFYLICREPAKPIQQVNETLDGTVDKVIQRALSKAAADRFTTCSDFMGALGVALGECRNWSPGHAANIQQTPTFSGAGSGAAKVLPVKPSGNPTKPVGGSKAAAAPVATEAAPVIAYELPAARRRRWDDDEEDDESSSSRPAKTGSGKKWAIVLALVGLVAAGAVFLKNWTPPPDLPVQVADTKNAPETPPPADVAVPPPAVTPPANAEKPHPQKQEPEVEKKPAASTGPHIESPSKPAEVPSRPKPHQQVAQIKPPLRKPAPGPSEITGGTSDVDLLSEPPGARVVVDDNPATSCTAPCTLSLPSGRHTLTMNENGFGIARRVFNVPQDTSVYAALNKSTGVLILTSIPNGARVVVDGQDRGRTPVTLHVPAGQHHIVVTYGGLQHEETVQVDNDQFIARTFRWTP